MNPSAVAALDQRGVVVIDADPLVEIARAIKSPDELVAMSDEWPRIYHRADWAAHGYDGEVEAGMVLSVESFVGSDSGGPGVKLEQM